MIKNKIALEIQKAEKTYHFFCEAASTVGEIYDVLAEMKGKVVQIIQEQQTKEQPQKPDETPEAA